MNDCGKKKMLQDYPNKRNLILKAYFLNVIQLFRISIFKKVDRLMY